MKHFKLYNNLVGWLTFAIAATTYLLTIEPTASFWDCGEFISSAFKLEVGHPPGAPFFMMTARLFTLFASDPSHVAMMVNSMSALCSAFTILFLFWTITHLARKILVKDDSDLSVAQTIAILGAGVVGGLAYTFSDTFWFSAVEGEVYAYSSLFTALVFWLILKWEDAADKPGSDRWLIIIAYMMGLSIGVHLLNLLAIPAIVLVYYFKKYTPSIKGVIITLVASGAILAAILYGMIPGFVKVASQFELLFVNQLGLPFNSGLIIYLILSVLALCWAIYQTQFGKNELLIKISFITALTLLGVPFIGDGLLLGLLIIAAAIGFLFFMKKRAISRRWLNTIILCASVMLIGYASYSMIVIRSMANTPMDQNSPEDVFSLQYYLNREQYGDRPLLYGAMYSAPEKLKVVGNTCEYIPKEGAPIWVQKEKTEPNEKDHYFISGTKHQGYEMDERFMMLFPRMYSSMPNHVTAYKSWGDVKGTRIQVDRCGNMETMTCPTFGENLHFFFKYQLNFMYWRYFMWNFSGRQNDIQSHGEIDHGNWITGFNFIDNAMLGDQTNAPAIMRENKGHNRYFLLPLLLGILGILWQLGNDKKGHQSFWVTFTLFFMTGIAIVIYLNQTPYQPRERDYAYAGSFYAFSIWIGLGVLGLFQALNKKVPAKLAAILAFLLTIGIPVLMASENWDDHDRSGRTTARDFGANYLNTCAPNAIIFSNGDNDTFPLWYNQEVEGVRTDMRVCNLSYLSADWYIDQMKRQAYESAPLPISWSRKDYVSGNLDISRVIDHPNFGGTMPLATALELIRYPNFIENGIGTVFASTVTVPVNKEQVLKTGTVHPKDSNQIVKELSIKLKRTLSKSELMVLEMINTNNWERPMYIAATVGEEYYPNIKQYFQLEGLAYRIVPINSGTERINTEAMYENLMHKFKYGGIENPNVYLDETNLRMCRTFRLFFGELAAALIQEGQKDKAIEVLDYCFKVIPGESVPHDYTTTVLASYYYELGKQEQGDYLVNLVANQIYERLDWIASLPSAKRNNLSREMSVEQNLGMLQNMYYNCSQNKSTLANSIRENIEKYYSLMPNK